jgi:hypothetical protein
MREFKSGTLKSGGSGKKVTNPKQAIAIALSEAEAMNRGGMMQNQVMRRPMFQTPQQRARSGIMAGVVPVQGYENGGSVPEYTPKFLREEEEEGITDNALFKAFVVDKNDPIDVGLSIAAAGMAATGVGTPIAALTKLVGVARKLGKNQKVIGDIVERSQEKIMQMERMGVFDKAKKVVGQTATKVGDYFAVSPVIRDIPEIASDPVGYATDTAEGLYGLGEEVVGLGGDLYDIGSDPEARSALYESAKEGIMSIPTELRSAIDMADGGVASLPVYMKDGGKIGFLESIVKNLRDSLKKGKIDESDIPKDLKPKVQVDTSGNVIDRDRPTSARREESAATSTNTKPDSKPETTTTDTKPVTKNTNDVAEDAVEDAKVLEKGKKQRPTIGRIIGRTALSTLLGVPALGLPMFLYTNPEVVGDLMDQGFDLDDDLKNEMSQLGDTLDKQEALESGAGFTLNQMPNLPAVVTPPASSQQQADETVEESSEEEVVTTPAAPFQQQEVEEERKKVLPGFRPFGGKIARALLGDDEAFGGERGAIDFIRKQDPQAEGGRGFLDNVISKLGDPRVQYQLAKAGQATEGFVPRNFGSDVTLAGAEYDDALAQREYIKAQTADKSTTELEKLTNFFMSTIDTSGADEAELLSLRNQIATSLNNMSRDEARQTLAAELVKAFGDDQYGIQAVKEIMQQLDTGESLASIVKRYKDYRQANQK